MRRASRSKDMARAASSSFSAGGTSMGILRRSCRRCAASSGWFSRSGKPLRWSSALSGTWWRPSARKPWNGQWRARERRRVPGTRFCCRRPARPSISTAISKSAGSISPHWHARRSRRLMARKLSSDKVLFLVLVALSLFGCVMIYSASAVSAAATGGNPYRYLVKQIVALAAGGLAAFAVYRADYRLFARRWLGLAVYGVCLVLCVAALTRPPINSARRWLTVGPVMLQPSELLKIGLVLVLARLMTAKVSEPERALP